MEKNSTAADHSSEVSPTKLRGKLSKQLRHRSRSLESVPEAKWAMSRITETSPCSLGNSPHGLQEAAELKSSKHNRQSPSNSSCNSEYSVTYLSDDNGNRSCKKRQARSSWASRLPKGVSPDKAAKILSSSVKTALGNHAHSESMGYHVLLPYEVVQLNDVISYYVTLLTTGPSGARKEN